MKPSIAIFLGVAGILAAIGTAIANANGLFAGHPSWAYWFYGASFLSLMAALVGWLKGDFRALEKRPSGKLAATAEPEPSAEILVPLNYAEVGLKRTVSGTVRPPNAKVQVFVLAGDGFWLQGKAGHAAVDGPTWTAECQFGNAYIGLGSNYQIVATVNTDIKDRRIPALPEGAVKSNAIHVRRTR
jgi:membrane protein implicated in regulation of membrane protease activity